MPRDGAVALSDLADPTSPSPASPAGYSVRRLMQKHGDARLTDLLLTIADCPKAKARAIHDPCRAGFEPFRVR
jgi:hypothetical protein